MSNIIKKDPVAGATGITLNKGKLRSSSSPFQQRVNQAKTEQTPAEGMANRIALLLDNSSSMGASERLKNDSSERRIDLLKAAIQTFVGRCNLNDTAIAAVAFNKGSEAPLTSNPIILDSFIYSLSANGSTPMHRCVVRALENYPMTRAVLISDGEATDWDAFAGYEEDETERARSSKDDILLRYKEAGIPIDCVHISMDSGGEALLRRIAELTGGLFIKFTDVSAFSTAFGYLAPGMRGLLTSGSVRAEDIGAREIK